MKIDTDPIRESIEPQRGPALLMEDELTAVTGGILIFPKSPPLGWTPENDPVTPPGGYTP